VKQRGAFTQVDGRGDAVEFGGQFRTILGHC
jgi:hypothetical protein